ncbi:t1pks [Epichloe bromicola]|uniref:T1pks n=1 Tax=Epichloe bromicola TaxID=79588 RepID=A0ABQ0CLI1_9HYPO
MSAPERIAIVGMSCRLSGGVTGPEDLWTMISRSRDGWGPIPESRFSIDAYYHPNPQKKGCFNVKSGYFIDKDLSQFDAPFFNITEQEAIAMDPQQRQLLECTYEALESAGIPKENISGASVGVFVGANGSSYKQGTQRDLNQVPLFDCTGNHQSIQAARISHCFNFRGPCLSIDTACSSGLHALHAAVQSLRSGEAESAIVAGCSLHLQPDDMISMSMTGLFNNHGKTFSFDHRAKSGFARGEGVGCLVLKPLEQALKDNDKIRCIITNTGTNQDGKTVGLSTPSGEAQEQLMREVYERANISPRDAGFIEAHGTGTKVGDPIEAHALHRVFGDGRTKRAPLFMGSVKSNIGHVENTSGIISVIKACLMLEKGFILPNVNFEKANEAIPLEQWNFKVPVNLRPWPRDKRFISINNFGFGGSNAHAVLERSPPSLVDLAGGSKGGPKLFVLCANDETSVKSMASQLGVYLEQHPEVFEKRILNDIAYTLSERRSHFPWRLAITASSCNDLAISLNDGTSLPKRAVSNKFKIGFIYTGQGAQWAQMGRELMDAYPVFAGMMHAAAACLEKLGAQFSLVDELFKAKEESNIGLAYLSQPSCTAVQLAMTDLLSSWGVKPSMVIGHSSGEIVAAYAAGAITLDDAMSVAYHRGQMAVLSKTRHPELKGAMLAVGCDAKDVQQRIKLLGLHGLTAACHNSPSSTTVSGDDSEIDQLAAELERDGLFNRKLRVDVAYHSPHMGLVAEDYLDAIKDMTPRARKPDVSFYSSLVGRRCNDSEELGPSYWVDNLVKPVLFSSAVQDMYEKEKPDVVIEIGPHAALEGPIKQILRAIHPQAVSHVGYLPTLVRNQNSAVALVDLAGKLFLQGHGVKFGEINQTNTAQRPNLITDFPPYPWHRSSFWFESRASKQHRLKPFARHDLLGTLDHNYTDSELTWRNVLSLDDVPWLKDHRMQSLVTFPMTGYLSMAVEAACQRAQLRQVQTKDMGSFHLREVQASKALIMDSATAYETVFRLRPYTEGTRSLSNDWDEFFISSWAPSRGWLEHCRGLVSVNKLRGANAVNSSRFQTAYSRRAEAHADQGVPVALDAMYTELAALGAEYGHAFYNTVDHVTLRGDYSSGTVTVIDTAPSMPFRYETPSRMPASFMDMILQVMYPILGAGSGTMPCLVMPSAISSMEISTAFPHAPGEMVESIVLGPVDRSCRGPMEFSLDVWHPSCAEPVVTVEGFKTSPVRSDFGEEHKPRSLCYKIQWEAVHRSRPSTNPVVTNGVHDKSEPSASAVVPSTNGINGHHSTASTQPSSALSRSASGAKLVVVTDRVRTDALVTSLLLKVERLTGVEAEVCPFARLQPDSSSHYICLDEMDRSLLAKMTESTFSTLQNLLLRASSVLWVTSGAYSAASNPERNVAQGLLRSVRSETTKALVTLDMDPNSSLDASSQAELILSVIETYTDAPRDDAPLQFEFYEQDGQLAVPRITPDDTLNTSIFHKTQPLLPYVQNFQHADRRLKMVVGTAGALDSLFWTDDPVSALADDEIEIHVACTGINFKDVVIAMGQLPSPYIGVECSGVVARIGSNVTSLAVGDRVCALPLGCYGTFARCRASSAAVIPRDMTFAVAASIPVVYCTAYYALVDLAQLQPGESILIHAASGGVGQAAMQLAQMIGAEIYATVGSAEKKQLLIDQYGIPESRVLYSRDREFGPAVRYATGGRGVDVVINSLAGDLLRESWASLAPFGRFIEIGKRDITSNSRLDMMKFDSNCTFSSLDLTLVATERPKLMSRIMSNVMNLLRRKIICPIGPIIETTMDQVEISLRKLQSGKTSGKLVVDHSQPAQVKATHPPHVSGTVKKEATYLIIGGTGGIGRTIAGQLIRQGAGHVVLLSRSGTTTPDIERLARESKTRGASIHVEKCDVADEEDVSSLLSKLRLSLPPIRGVIHAAMVLRDVLFEKLTFQDYDDVVRSKIRGALNFDRALRNDEMDFFVLLSSVAGIVGSRGQAAYAGANTFLDALARHRRQSGRTGTSLNLTAVEDVGYLATTNAARRSEVLKNISGGAMSEKEVLALVDAAVHGQMDDGQCITGLDLAATTSLPYWADDGKFSSLREKALASLSTASAASSDLSIADRLKGAPSLDDAVELIASELGGKLASILMLAPEDLEARKTSTTITAFGLDSLNAIELRNWIGKELQAHLQVLELLTSGKLNDLAALVLKKTRLTGAWAESNE